MTLEDINLLKKRSISRRTFTKGSLMGMASLWLSDHLRGESPRGSDQVSRLINPLIGATTSMLLGEGKTFPGTATPFGMVQPSPDTITGGLKRPSTQRNLAGADIFRIPLMTKPITSVAAL